MARWLFKEDPDCSTFADLERDGQTIWDGVSNALALIHLRQVKRGDRIFFYQTGKDKAIVGEMKAIAVDGDRITVAPVRRLKQPVTLATIKQDKVFSKWELVRNSRLSVMPVSDDVWRRIEEMAD